MAPEVDRTQARAASSISAVSDLDLTDDGNTRGGIRAFQVEVSHWSIHHAL